MANCDHGTGCMCGQDSALVLLAALRAWNETPEGESTARYFQWRKVEVALRAWAATGYPGSTGEGARQPLAGSVTASTPLIQLVLEGEDAPVAVVACWDEQRAGPAMVLVREDDFCPECYHAEGGKLVRVHVADAGNLLWQMGRWMKARWTALCERGRH